MKPEPYRLNAATYPRHKTVPIRFADVDMFRHLNNVATGQFYEEARFELLAEARELVAKEDRGALVIASVNTSFLGQARYPGTIDVGTGILRVGERSLVIAQGLFVGGKCIGVADSVIVSTGPEGAVPIADPVRLFFSSLVIAAD
ncbi:acyl-CoA thioester hydrolase [Sphingopyxis panaciterrae]|uniref:thioesterase family protein n=1 Tax=Sphingopyxis panaciterrae TaxID=363841 RepID=UPI00141FD1C4|nr:acyl-CoA thioester hydrolase [Sphingopyxis panaciterrae]